MDTSTTYLGLRLANPFMAGASPLSAHLDSVKRLEDAGAAAIVMHSLFEEQITLAESGRIHHRDPLDAEFAAALAPFPPAAEYTHSPQEYLEHVQRVKQSVAVPVIASLNGTTQESWLRYALLLQEAGADALEVNYYEVVTDLDVPGVAVETRLRGIVVELKRALKIPVAVKLSPYFTAFGNVAQRLDAAGADGLILFNRFYQPDIDIRHMTAGPNLELSRSPELWRLGPQRRSRWRRSPAGPLPRRPARRVRRLPAVPGVRQGTGAPHPGVQHAVARGHGDELRAAVPDPAREDRSHPYIAVNMAVHRLLSLRPHLRRASRPERLAPPRARVSRPASCPPAWAVSGKLVQSPRRRVCEPDGRRRGLVPRSGARSDPRAYDTIGCHLGALRSPR